MEKSAPAHSTTPGLGAGFGRTHAIGRASWKIASSVMAAFAGIMLLVLGSTTGAHAAGPGAIDAPPPDNQPDRVVYIDRSAPKPPNVHAFANRGTAQATVAKPNQFPVIPAPGETVRVIYTDAVTDVTTLDSGAALAATAKSCTQSITVGTPYKYGGKPYVDGSALISSGCSSRLTFTVTLYGGGTAIDHSSFLVPNIGSVFGIQAFGGTCRTSSSTGYMGIGKLSTLAGGSSWGPTKRLPCSV